MIAMIAIIAIIAIIGIIGIIAVGVVWRLGLIAIRVLPCWEYASLRVPGTTPPGILTDY